MTAYLRDGVGKTALKRKITPKNPHQLPAIRISSSRLPSQTIWAAVLSCWLAFYS
jgi:hypothetical protein